MTTEGINAHDIVTISGKVRSFESCAVLIKKCEAGFTVYFMVSISELHM